MLGKNTGSYKAWERDRERYAQIPAELDVANLGSTCDANNFDYTLWDKRGFNFASAPQDMYYDNQLLEQYGTRLKAGARVFISISEFAFLVDKYDADRRNFKYYGYLEPQRILKYTDRKARMVLHCPGLLDRRLLKQEARSFLKRILHIQRNSAQLSLEQSSRRTMSNWMREFGWDDGARLTEAQRNTIHRSWAIFLKDIEYCRRNKLIPVVVIPPFNKYLKAMMPNEILEECLWKYIGRIKEMNIRVVDLWNDAELEKEKYYSTPICLNEAGKKIFNEKLEKTVMGEGEDGTDPDGRSFNAKGLIPCNGRQMPCVAFGTGVVKRFYRNKPMYLKDTGIALLRSVKHRKMARFLKNDMVIRDIMDKAIQHGYRAFDSGRLYGHSEKYIGEVAGRYDRDDLFLITKVSDVDLTRYPNAATVHDNLSLSLKFLNTDYVDAYLLHFPSGDWLSMYRDIEKEYRAGRAKLIGVCNFDMDELKLLIEKSEIRPMICQVELHPLNTKRELREFCRANGIVVMAHTPTAHMDKRVAESEIILDLVKKYNKTAAQIIYRWHYENSVIPIVSTISETHLRENMEIFDFSLSDDEKRRIEELNLDCSFDKNNNKMNDHPGFVYNL